MSTVPKASNSNVADLTVTPAGWEHYPSIEASYVKGCTFTNLSSTTHISSSHLQNVKLSSEKGGTGNFIKSSRIVSCTISDSSISRCDLQDTHVSDVRDMERSKAVNTEFAGAELIERSSFDDSRVADGSTVSRSAVKRSNLAGNSRVERSSLHGVDLYNSWVDRASLTNCDVKDCGITSSTFSGMVLRYGIWNGKDLVGRTSSEHEPIAISMTEWKAQEDRDAKARKQEEQFHPEEPAQMTTLSSPSSVPVPAPAIPSTLYMEQEEQPPPPPYTPLPPEGIKTDAQTRASREFTPPTPTSDGFSHVTALANDNDGETSGHKTS
ncbi:hypothetical protein PRK78_006714 [Emydomyces testavorans]|uniref:Uncharacterized protein n=1 Tax=Emydomyces testavorans TaxID=2070801 RepID=A0AAF0DLX9_9EURO|nr:hypothetical protein PRK78_006714 [Emydomyces testavorans]